VPKDEPDYEYAVTGSQSVSDTGIKINSIWIDCYSYEESHP